MNKILIVYTEKEIKSISIFIEGTTIETNYNYDIGDKNYLLKKISNLEIENLQLLKEFRNEKEY